MCVRARLRVCAGDMFVTQESESVRQAASTSCFTLDVDSSEGNSVLLYTEKMLL